MLNRRPRPATFYEAVYALVREVPRGRVMTYGQIATILGSPSAAKAVGNALHLLGPREADVPWQRVINHRGGISGRGDYDRADRQLALLEAEGVVFRSDGTCDLRTYRWEPGDPDAFFFDTARALPF